MMNLIIIVVVSCFFPVFIRYLLIFLERKQFLMLWWIWKWNFTTKCWMENDRKTEGKVFEKKSILIVLSCNSRADCQFPVFNIFFRHKTLKKSANFYLAKATSFISSNLMLWLKKTLLTHCKSPSLMPSRVSSLIKREFYFGAIINPIYLLQWRLSSCFSEDEKRRIF